MTENTQDKSFAQLLEESDFAVGQELQVGDKIRGRIIAIGKDQAYVDTGTKTDAVVEKQELTDEDGIFLYQEGDEVELFVVSSKRNEMKLGRSMGSAEGGVEELEQAMHNRIPVQGKVQQTCKGGFRVRVMGRTAFCPLSQIDIRPVDDAESLVGESFDFLISRVEEKGRNIIVSRRALQEKERAAKKAGKPSFSMGMQYMVTGLPDDPAMAGSASGNDAVILPTVGISIPLYRKKYRAMVRETVYRQEATGHQRSSRQNNLETLLEKGLKEYRDAKRRIALFERQTERARQVIRLMESQYATAGNEFDELLRLERDLLRYAIEQEKARADQWAAVAFIDYLTGK